MEIRIKVNNQDKIKSVLQNIESVITECEALEVIGAKELNILSNIISSEMENKFLNQTIDAVER